MSRRGDLLDAALWAVAGGAITVASWGMDRLEDRGINPWSAPGLTPGIVGFLMVVLAAMLALRSPPAADAGEALPPAPGALRRTALALALCIGFAGLSLGHGLPFVVEGAVFIFVFTTLFSLRDWRSRRCVRRGLLQTLAIAAGASVFISWLFESVFLVRLP